MATFVSPWLRASPACHVGDRRRSPSRILCSVSPEDPRAPTALKNDLLLRVARGEKVERTPVWLFRQAGRHLPEYRDYKAETGKNFLELLADPKDVAEVTMQPVRRYDVDAAILFSDILVIPEALGLRVIMPGGVGILVPEPLSSPEDMEKRIDFAAKVEEKLPHVLESVREIKRQLNGKVPLIGFSAAPWTLMFYMVGGSSKKNTDYGMRWLKDHPKESQRLLEGLTEIVTNYLVAQIDNGADIVQVFEAMGEFIEKDYFYEFAMPCMAKIVSSVKALRPGVSVMVFPRGATYSLRDLSEAGYDVVTLDSESAREETRRNLSDTTLQGNFRPQFLIPGADTDISIVKNETEQMLRQLGPQRLIANLGEGLGGKEDPELVTAFVNSVHAVSESIIKESEHS